MNFSSSEPVLLFFGEPTPVGGARWQTQLKHLARPLYKRLKGQPTITGFHVAFNSLLNALRASGYRVRVNDYAAARRNPDYPIGVLGYPQILEGWELPNPAILGPGMYDHPSLRPDLMRDPRFRYYIVPSQWMMDLFAGYYGDRCLEWFAGIDTAHWSDTSAQPKDIDVVIYDKVHWNRERYEPELIEPIVAGLRRRNVSIRILRYGQYRYPQWRDLLRRSRALVFLSEHETQGIAYQEAMASGLPVLAWDQGWWLDPNRERYTSDAVRATPVPFFGPECGETFANAAEFETTLDTFLSRLKGGLYQPRRYVARKLSLTHSAEIYMRAYRSLVPPDLGGAGGPTRMQFSEPLARN